MSYPTETRSKFFDDLDTFFVARKLKRRGPKADEEWLEDGFDYGVWWKDDQGHVYRLTWIGAVHRQDGEGGELYFVRLDGPHVAPIPDGVMISAGEDRGLVEFLGVIPPVREDENFARPSNSWRRIYPDARAEQILEGWGEVCGAIGSVQWVRDRMAQAIAEGNAKAP